MVNISRLQLAISTAGAILLTIVVRFLLKGYAVRWRMRGLPGPPGHSWLWGHLKVMGDAVEGLPIRAHPLVPLRMQKKYNLPNYFYMDLWPIGDPMLYVFDPGMVQQLAVDHPQPKHVNMARFMIHIAGPGDIVSTSGAHWKKWRSIMNPGFASGHLMTLVPGMVDDGVIFTNKLSEHAAKGDVFRLEDDASRLTIDIIGRNVLDMRLESQLGDNEMVDAFRELVLLLPNGATINHLKMYYPIGVWKRWKINRTLNNYIGRVIDERYATQQTKIDSTAGAKKQRKRAIIDLALEEYQSSKTSSLKDKDDVQLTKVDEEFKRAAIVQIRTFIFAGHDTTSSTICYALYMLEKYPKCLARIREEHDRVIGSIEQTPDKLRKDPHVLNGLVYTTCVIRETLRLWPPASSVRTGDPGFMLRSPEGELLPTEGILVWAVHYAMQRSPDIWGESANVFDPSRFLPENAANLPDNAWRPFEKGPRNCIGQDLALIEVRVVLALIVRRFEFKAAFDSLAELKDGSFWTKDPSFRKGRLDLDGEEAYQVLLGSAKPRESMPVRVKEII